MIRSTILAAAIAMTALSAQARECGPVVTGGGEAMAISHPCVGNVVGGGPVTIHGAGEAMEILYAASASGNVQGGRVAHLVGGGEAAEISYSSAGSSALASR